MSDCPLGRSVDGKHVVAVDDFGRDAVGRSAVGYIVDLHLLVERRRVGVEIVVAEIHDRQAHHCRHVEAFVPIAPAGRAVPGVVEDNIVFATVLHRESQPARDRDAGSDGGDDGHAVASRAAHVHVPVAATGGTRGTAHVLGEDLPRLDAPNEQRGHVSVRRGEPVARPGMQRAPDGYGLLAATRIASTLDLALAVELEFDAFLEFPHQEHVVEAALTEFSVDCGA